jgi:hypothetical protein
LRSHWNWSNDRTRTWGDEKELVKSIKADVETESRGGGWKVVTIDQVHRISEGALDALHDVLERHPAGVTFILCTTEPHLIGVRTRSLLQHLQVVSPSVPDRARFLATICEREGIEVEEGVLDLIASHAEPGFRTSCADLEYLSLTGRNTVRLVRQHYGLDYRGVVPAYFAALVAGEGYQQQIRHLHRWSSSPENKLRAIEAYLLDAFSSDVLNIVGCSGATQAGLIERAKTVEKLTARGVQLAMQPHAFWRAILQFWKSPPNPSEADLIRITNAFDDYINGTMRAAETDEPLIYRPRQRARPPGTEQQQTSARVRNDGRSAGYLSLVEAKDLWDAASYMRQMYGAYFNTRLLLRWGASDACAKVLTNFLRELRMYVQRRNNSSPFHYMYTHENECSSGRATRIIAAIPYDPQRLEEWLERYIQRHASRSSTALSCELHLQTPPPSGRADLHWRLVKELCRGLDPAAADADDRCGDGGSILDLLEVPLHLHEPIGLWKGNQRCNMARHLSLSAREAVDPDLSFLSAFQNRCWSALASDWEKADFEYRSKLEAQRLAWTKRTETDWKDDGNDLTSHLRAERLREFQEAWQAHRHAREARRPGFGAAC